MSDHDHIDALKAAADPVRVAAALGLRSRGGRFFCPSCQPGGGKTPDLVIKGQGFFCHKCGLKGDILKLIQETGRLTFPEAVAFMEKETGIRPPEKGRKREAQTGRHGDKSRGQIVEPGPPCEAAGVYSAAYLAFLSACRPVEGRALEWLMNRGISEAVISALGLRFCGREYLDIMTDLKARFDEAILLSAGLMKRSKAGRPVPLCWHYYIKKAGFLVIPYLLDGGPVYLKFRPPVSKEGAERLKLVRFMNTAAAVPCLYNADALKQKPERVLICEGESDTWAALSNGWPAVGSPGARNFKEAWAEAFRGIEDEDGRSRVFLVMDADKAGTEGSRIIADLFLKAGLPVPLRMTLPPGMDLTDYMRNAP